MSKRGDPVKWKGIVVGAAVLAIAILAGALTVALRSDGARSNGSGTRASVTTADPFVAGAVKQALTTSTVARSPRPAPLCQGNADESDATGDDRSNTRPAKGACPVAQDNQAGDSNSDQGGDNQAGDTGSDNQAGDTGSDNQAGDGKSSGD
jgi:hypothetical protein